MENETLTGRIVGILASVSGKPASGITGESLLIDDLELDSINFIELDHEIKGIGLPSIPDQELNTLQTVADVVRYLSLRLEPAPPTHQQL